jgi:hypothetical protein
MCSTFCGKESKFLANPLSHLVVIVVVLFDTESYFVAQTGLELTILLPLPPKYWDCRCAPPCVEHFLSIQED